MAVVQNVTTESGDVLLIKTDQPAIGLLALLSYSDSLTGESGTLTFKREFSYSFDNILWSNWQLLTNDNIVNVHVQPNKPLYLQYRYTRQGSDNESAASWLNTEIQSTLQDNKNDTGDYYYDMSDFKCFFENTDVSLLNWYLNVTEKIYRQNLLPTYISRAFSDNFEDKDFIDFYLSIAKFFSYYVYLARKLTNIKDNNSKCANLLSEYIQQWGLYVCGDETNSELNQLRINLYNEFAKRGTYDVVTNKNVANEYVLKPKGEFLRLICFDEVDEFIFALYKPQYFAWNIDNSSPLYRGLFFHINANKAYEKTQFNDLTLYPIIDNTNSALITEGDKKVLQLTIQNGDHNGFDYMGNDKLIVISPYMSYEMSFLIKCDDDVEIDYGVKAYKTDKSVDDILNAAGSANQQYGLVSKTIQLQGQYKLVRMFIYGFLETQYLSVDPINGVSNFRFKESNNYIVPVLKITTTGSTDVRISDFRITPAFTNYERILLGVKNFVSIWLKNNSDRDKDTIEEILKHYLLPYNIVSKITYINDLAQTGGGGGPTNFNLKLYFDWTGIPNVADYLLTLKMYENGVLKPLIDYPMNVDNGTSQPDAIISLIENAQYNLLLKQTYIADLEYSFDNSNWTVLPNNLFYLIANFICTADVNVYIRKRTSFNLAVEVDDIKIIEGNKGVFTITRTGDTGVAVDVTVQTENITAIAGTNYTAIAPTVISFAVGEIQKQKEVITLDDGVVTGDLTFKFKLVSATAGATITTPFGTGTIIGVDGISPLLKVKKENWAGFAKAEITENGNVTSLQNDNTAESTVQKNIENKSYSLKVFASLETVLGPIDVNSHIDAYEVTCQGETKYILFPSGNVQFDLLKTPISNEILVSFRKLEWIGHEQTASCFCDLSCINQYETVKTVGSTLTYDVRYKVFNGTSFVQVKQHAGTNNNEYQSKISDLGSSFKVLISASSSSLKKIRISFYGTSGTVFLQQDFQTSVVDLEFNSVTPNIYILIQELS